MPKIEPHISKYIDSSIDKAKKGFSNEVKVSIKSASKAFGDEIRQDLKEFTDDFKRHNAALLERVDNHMGEFHRVVSSLPTESSVREIFREEIHPFDLKLNLCVSEIGQLNTKMDGVLAITNNHEERISSLELEAV